MKKKGKQCVAVMAVILFLGAWIKWSPDFFQLAYGDYIPIRVESFSFYGYERVSPNTLSSISNAFKGRSLFGDWSSEMMDRIKALPQVKSVWLIKDVTGHVNVQIDERKAMAIVRADQWYYIDDEAFLMSAVSDLESDMDLVLISGPWKNELDIRRGREKLYQGLELYTWMVSNGVPEESISELVFDGGQSQWISYMNQIQGPVYFGRDHLMEKVRHFATIFPQLLSMKSSIAMVDVRFDDRVVVKLHED
ncbi:MAG: hypothetical protein R3A11_07435 [Bdellovibrionota bacterium]